MKHKKYGGKDKLNSMLGIKVMFPVVQFGKGRFKGKYKKLQVNLQPFFASFSFARSWESRIR